MGKKQKKNAYGSEVLRYGTSVGADDHGKQERVWYGTNITGKSRSTNWPSASNSILYINALTCEQWQLEKLTYGPLETAKKIQIQLYEVDSESPPLFSTDENARVNETQS